MELGIYNARNFLYGSKDDLDLIDVLWRQDVDLGVGKEVYDQNLRQELEKEREVERAKEQEKHKAQRVAREKEDHQKQEQANKWLQENYTRDGETGEWVRLQNQTGNVNNSLASGSVPLTPDSIDDNYMTLEAALDYISARVDPNILHSLETQEEPSAVVDTLSESFVENCVHGMPQCEQEQLQSVPQIQPQSYLEHQDSLEESWNGLVSYLDMVQVDTTINVTDSNIVGDNITAFGLDNNIVGANVSNVNTFCLEEQLVQPVSSQYDSLANRFDQSDCLLHNATLPSSTVDIGNDFPALTPVTEMNTTLAPQSLVGADDLTPDGMDWDLEDMSFFNNLTTMQGDAVADLDLVEVNDFFKNVSDEVTHTPPSNPINLQQGMDSLQMLEEDLNNGSVFSMASTSPRDELSDAFDGLEGATGGSDVHSSSGDLGAPYNKVSRLSESSNDSGFAYQGSFSSSSPSSSPSSSSVAGSPAASHNGNSSTTSNDTDHDPHGSRTLAQHHVAHNHTYNTPPGQVPREVKKYAQKEPSKKGPHSRDQRRAQEMKIPFTIDEIIESPVETFNDMLTKYKLSDAQLALVRDIRRRGKNKVAAQNCRKRKVGVIVTLADEMDELQKVRDRLLAERAQMEQEARRMREKFGSMYTQIFQSLRNDRGEPYDPNRYSLQQSSDGNIFLVPRTPAAASRNSTRPVSSSSSAAAKEAPHENNSSRKRKSVDQ